MVSRSIPEKNGVDNTYDLDNYQDVSLALTSLLENQSFSDVVLKAHGREWAVHKCILAMRSEVFKFMFTGDFKENPENAVDIKEVNTDTRADAFDHMIKFIYTNDVKDMNNLEVELYYLADRYQIAGLKLKCERQLNVDNCLDILINAKNYNLEPLAETAQSFAGKELQEIMEIGNGSKWMSFVKENPELSVQTFRAHFKTPVRPSFSIETSEQVLRSALGSLLKNLILTDVILKADGDGREWAVHKCILTIRSDVFATMFTSDFKEKREETVLIKDVNSDAFNLMIQFIYTNDVADMDSLELELFYLADRYHIPGLKLKCKEQLQQRLNIDNCLDILVNAKNSNLEPLVETAQCFVGKKLPKMCEGAKWMSFVKENPELSVDLMREYFVEHKANSLPIEEDQTEDDQTEDEDPSEDEEDSFNGNDWFEW